MLCQAGDLSHSTVSGLCQHYRVYGRVCLASLLDGSNSVALVSRIWTAKLPLSCSFSEQRKLTVTGFNPSIAH